MRNWPVKTIGETCDILDSRRIPITKKDRKPGPYPYYGATGILSYVESYIFDERLVLVGEDGAKWGAGDNSAFIAEGKYWVNNHAHVIRPNRSEVLDTWLVYFLNFSDLAPFIKGLTVPKLNQENLRSIPIPVPPIEEQMRIVAILDEAFAAIDKAKANTEKNIHNARELFDSYLNNIFSNPGPDWEEDTLGNIATFRNGINFTKSSRGEKLKIVGVKDFQKHFWAPMEGLDSITADGTVPDSDLLKENDILFVRSNGNKDLIGRSILVGSVDEKITHSGFTIRARINGNESDARYVCRYVKSDLVRQKMIEGGTGTNIKSLNQTMLSEISIPLPSLAEQREIVSKLEVIDSNSKELDSTSRRKIAELDELKRSILQKAFSGDLSMPESNVIEFPQKFTGITATDLHAGIIATAYRLHEQKGKLLHFHHVKAEKIVHMAEAFVGIDLERHPTKMAAGPNDFPRMHRVEHRAKTASFFHVEKKGGVYSYSPGNKIDSIISKTKEVLGDKYGELESLIEKMISWDAKAAEILATTFAAWNNLLIDGMSPTDEDIVTEARENWHKEKRNIPRERFFGAIKWMRDKNVLPRGLGRKVEVKEDK